MTIIKSIHEINNIDKSVITIGNFDGLHKGHIRLINRAIDFAKKEKIKSVVFTFSNHPQNYFKEDTLKNIISNDDKIDKLTKLGVDIIISLPFNDYMANISAIDFLENILIEKLGAKKIIIGHDFTFAKCKEGNSEFLSKMSAKYNFLLDILKPVEVNNIRVSSTYIRKLLKHGEVENIKSYLGYNYELYGDVIHAKALGRTIGFPTANIEIDKRLAIPKIGIYATKVHIDDSVYMGATNIGYNPTVNGDKISIETNILEFDKDIYGKEIRIEFLERIRDEKKFNSLEELKIQLKIDTCYIYEKYICKTL